MTIQEEIARRRTFAIISHPDAGKTTLTEKLLLYGGAIHLAGSVRARRNMQSTASDWMEMERKRGISITSTALEFPYDGFQMNLLDTPGHQDFSEDTYRTLVAADSAVMLIDSAKGIEPQTLKLFDVCRNRGIPIFTFFNKMDRPGLDPLDLIDELEKVLGIGVFPMNWPLGNGTDFKGVYDRLDHTLHLFERTEHGKKKAPSRQARPSDPFIAELAGHTDQKKLIDDVELLDAAGEAFDREAFLDGKITPCFFGSAITNFGVELFLDRFKTMAPEPGPRLTEDGRMHSPDAGFAGFIFKIQANMDPAHRDRIAFLRVCSGKFERGMIAQHARLGKTLKLSQAHRLFGQERISADEAWPGDIIGLISPGHFALGDTLYAGHETVAFDPIPRFAPEHFAMLRVENPSQRDPFLKGVNQLLEEGAVQVLYRKAGEIREPILAAVGPLQFEVVQYRLETEYRVPTRLERLPFTAARWIKANNGKSVSDLRLPLDARVVADQTGQPVILVETSWSLNRLIENNPEFVFSATSRGH
jgi:peptide chain release factor 3